jgi:hypothetical protein
MAGRASRHAPVDDVKPLTEDRKNLIERYTVDADEAVSPAVPPGEPEAPAAVAEPSAVGTKTGGAVEPHTTVALAGGSIGNGRAAVETSSLGADLDEERAGLDEQAEPAREASEKRDTSRPRRAGRPRSQGAGVDEERTGSEEEKAVPAAKPDEKGGTKRTRRVGKARRRGADADEAPAGRDEQAKPAPKASEKPDTSRPRRAGRLGRQVGGADEAPAGESEQAAAPGASGEKGNAEEHAWLAAEAEVRRLTEELARLAAEAKAVHAGQQPPQLDAAAEVGRTVEAQRTLKAVDVPIDVAPVEQTETCYVARWRGYLTCEFFARRPDGTIVATSGTFRWRKSTAPPDDGPAREAFDRLVAELRGYGWEERGQGLLWYERRFERPERSMPSERQAAPARKSRY